MPEEHGLPEYDRPPVVETVLSAQFEPLSELSAAHLGLFWHSVKDKYPKADVRPPLMPVAEMFETEHAARVRFEKSTESPQVRVWLLNETGTELIQIQNGRFIKNWRKTGERESYPRYERTRTGFDQEFAGFRKWLAEEGLGDVQVNQCEVTYVNHIVAGSAWQSWAEAPKIFSFVTDELAGMEDLGFLLRFPIEHGGLAVGRVHVEVSPAVAGPDRRPAYVMNLTARGQIGSGVDFLAAGREAIVRTFTRLTTPLMHETWGRTR